MSLPDPTKREEKRCEQCGRVGVRGFRTLTADYEFEGHRHMQTITVCAAKQACQSRWPKRSEDELDRLLA